MLFEVTIMAIQVGKTYSDLPLEDLLFSAGGGFLFGALAGYAIKKVMKIAAVILGLFVAGLPFLAYKGWIDIKWTAMEKGTRLALTDVATQLMHTVNNTASQFATQSSTIATSGSPIAAGFVPRLLIGFKRG
jgi:uncharacterized membrane protein (Fun14 family)